MRKKRLFVVLRLLRIRHWIKNLLIFAPLFFAGYLFTPIHMGKSILLFIAFCAVASGIYIINDIEDKGSDMLHPKKKNRPLAANHISLSFAGKMVFVLFAVGIVASFFFPWKTNAALFAYVLLNILYTYGLKHLPLIDIFLVTLLYLIRIYAGGQLFATYISPWLILCTFFLALFLITAKRRSEFALFVKGTKTRGVLAAYNKDFLDHLLTITMTSLLVSYSLYVISTNKPYMIYTTILVVFGMVRYLYLVYQSKSTEAPETVLVEDFALLSTVSIWVLSMLGILYIL